MDPGLRRDDVGGWGSLWWSDWRVSAEQKEPGEGLFLVEQWPRRLLEHQLRITAEGVAAPARSSRQM